MKNKQKQCLFISVACILLIMVCIGAEIFSKSNQEAEEAPPVVMLKDQYNGYGLPVGTELSAKILLENQELVCYTDRIFVHFQPKEDSVQRIKAIVDGMNHKCPELENIYILPIPHRILAETGYEEEAVLYQTHLDAIASEMPENAVVVNALDELNEHAQEYVFFRTQDAWTARGAYYGTTELCEELGLAVIPLESYYEYTYNTFTGDLPAREDVKNVDVDIIPSDHLYFYILPESVNRAEIFAEDEAGTEISYKKPLITFSARNLGAFIDGNYKRAVVDGEPCNGEKQGEYLLVVCDRAGMVMVPFLKDYYDGIYVVNIKEDYNFFQDINSIVAQYNIKDIVWMQNTNQFGEVGYYRALEEFAESGQSNE